MTIFMISRFKSFLQDWLRNEIKFNSLRELRDQIATDKVEVLKLFRTNKVKNSYIVHTL